MINWNLRRVMAEKGVWSGQELVDLLKSKAGIILSHNAVMNLIKRPQKAIRFTTLEALCVALEVSPWDIITYTPDSADKRRIVGGEPIAPYKQKSKSRKDNNISHYPEEEF
jgi:putative transcriptional regulator